jgi:Cdc6-like AAA superfamily ATPase
MKSTMAGIGNTTDINRCFMRFEERAERIETSKIVETFVSVGPLLDVLGASANQIIYGRRGTGKTHALKYFEDHRNKSGDIAIYIDCQNIGSNGSIYNDNTLPISERATRLLVDVLSAMHWSLMDAFSDPNRGWNLSDAAPVLDELAGC